MGVNLKGLPMAKLIGKKVWFTGVIGAYDPNLMGKMCIEDVHCVEGFERDHCWVTFTKRINLKRGTKISFTAILYEFVGLVGDERVTKIGLGRIRHVKEIK